MNGTLLLLGLLSVISAGAAMCLRNLVHAALCFALTFAGLAGLYLHLGAQFIGLAQLLVYVGAVAILIVFAILLTRGAEPDGSPVSGRGAALGVGIGAMTFVALISCLASGRGGWARADGATAFAPGVSTVRGLGEQLMEVYVLPLEVLAVLLTAATLGAVVLALEDRARGRKGTEG